MAKNLHFVVSHKSTESLALTLFQAWEKFESPEVPEKQKLGYLRLTEEFKESIMLLAINGPSVMAIDELRKKIQNTGIKHWH